MTTGDLYSLLGVAPNASADDIKAAYRTAARRFHPDVNPHPNATEEFKLIADAYAILNDPAQRVAYDRAIAQTGTGPLLSVRTLFSREVLPLLSEPQVLYTLVEIHPSIANVELPTPPVNLCIVIDRSTSMQGSRLDQVKASVLHVIDNLRENDTCAVVAFSDKAEVVVPAQRGTMEKTLAKAKVSTVNASGGTEILQGLLTGLMELHQQLSPSAVNHLILLTDGHTYGDEDECLLLAGLAATDGISISGLGIGEEWNDRFLDELTSATGGVATYISSPQQVKTIILDRMRGLNAAYAERLTMQVTLDLDVKLDSAFKVSPEAGPVTVDGGPLRLGSMPKEQPISVLLRFLLPPLSEGKRPIARLSVYGDVVSLGRRGERSVVDILLPVSNELSMDTKPSPALVEALSRLSQYRLQERASQEASEGDITSATRRLSTLGTRLLATGQTDLAKVALAEARRLEKTHALSEDAKKHLKYGTRALMLAPPSAGK